MIEYFFKVVTCSSLFLGFYFFLLQKEKMFRFNRAYLLITICLSLSIPFFFITLPGSENKIEYLQETPSGEKQLIATDNIENNRKNENPPAFTEQNIVINKPQQAVLIEKKARHTTSEWIKYAKWENILLFFYISIASLLIIKFSINFFIIYTKVFRSKKVSYNGIFLVINEQKEQLYSFWKYIFIPKQNLNENFSRKELLEHEIAHIRQRHSLDILFIELIKSIFWFNPTFYLYKKAIQLNHEFLADEAVLKTKADIYEYQKLILSSIQVKRAVPIASNFNYILTKKRLLMMTKKGNSARAILLQFFSLPFILILVYVFSNKVYAQEKIANELTLEQKEQLKQALQIDDISDYLKDTLVSGSQNYIDTLMIGNKAYIISSPKEVLEKIFKDGNNQKVSELPKEEFSMIFKNSTPEEIEKAFAIRELKESDQQKIWIWSTNTNNTYSYKVFPINSKDENEHTTVEYYNSPEWKKKVKEMEKKGQEVSAYYNSPEWKQKVKEMEKKGEEVSAYYNSPEWKKKVEDMEKKGEEVSAYYNSPEWKRKVEEMERKGQEISVYYNSQRSKSEIGSGTNVNLKQEIKKDNSKIVSLSVNEQIDKSDMDEFKEEMRKFKQEMSGLGRQIRNLSKN